MPPPRRKLQATAEETLTPPPQLSPGQAIARVHGAAGNNLYNVELADGRTMLVELEARFRSQIWLRRGGFVVVDSMGMERENKIQGEIVNVVRDERSWRKERYWPKEFEKKMKTSVVENSDEEESNVGKLPPSDSDQD